MDAMPEMYERNVIQADEWARHHQAALAQLYQAFERRGNWPDVGVLQRELNRRDETRDLIAELRDMPPSLGIVEHEGEVRLSVRGLAAAPGSEQLLDAYMEVIKLGVRRYKGDDERPEVGDEDLREELGMEEALAKRVALLVFTESWPFGSGSGTADSSWRREIPLEMRHLIGADKVGDFLEVQAKLRYGPAIVPTIVVGQMTPTPAVSTPPQVSPLARAAKAKPLRAKIALQLVFKELERMRKEHLFVEGFEEGAEIGIAADGETITLPPRIQDPEAWLMLNLGERGIWRDLEKPDRMADGSGFSTMLEDREMLLRTLELLHQDVVSTPVFDGDNVFEGMYDRSAGQRQFRAAMQPILARLEPAMEMRSNGEIVEQAALGLAPLGDQPLPDSPLADDVRSKVLEAIRTFRESGAGREAQLSALAQLAGVLELLREDRRLDVLSKKDQAPLFAIANEYGIRHDNSQQRRDYGPAFREWIFFAYLGAIRLAIRVCDGDNDD